MSDKDLEIVRPLVNHYYESFLKKTYGGENSDRDFLMELFNISPDLKRENRQYWGRELGMLWQLLVTAVVKGHFPMEYKPSLKIGLN